MALDLELKSVDATLKRRHSFWETPRNLVVVIGTIVAICTGLGSLATGLVAYRLGQESPKQDRPIVIQLVRPPAAAHE